jgi:hypothetical protein
MNLGTVDAFCSKASLGGFPNMSRNALYLVIAILVAIVVVFGIYLFYQQTQKPRLEIKLDEQGITVDGNG